MARTLAVCSHCDLLFESPIFDIPDGSSITFQGIGTNCPRCQRNALFINGIHKTVGDTIQIIADDPVAAAVLPSLIEALKKAKREKASKEEVERIIDETAPSFSFLKAFLSQPSRMEVWAILAILIPSLIAILQSASSQPTVQVIVNKTIATCAAKPYIKPRPKKKVKRKPRVRKTRHK